MKKVFVFLFGGLLMAASMGSADAAFVISHTGSADPTTEGFAAAGLGSSTVGPLANDMGYAAWSVAGISQGSQTFYYSGALSTSQRADIANQGFVLTADIRVLQGSSPVYSSATPYVTDVVQLDTGFRRFDMHFGVNNSGDTVVVLPTSFNVTGANAQAFGAAFTLTGLGSTYHTYQLVFDPLAQLADLFVDGVERIQGYAGNTSFLENVGLRWGASGGGQGNFASAQLATPQVVPEPSSLVLFVIGAFSLARRVYKNEYGVRRSQ